MNTIETIKQSLNDMTRSERLVASYFLGNTNAFVFSTLDGIAEQIGTSTTSVLRFCRRLGFDGYKSFQNEIRTEIHHQPNLPDKFRRTLNKSTEDTLLTGTIRQDIHCIGETFQDMDARKLHEATEQITRASHVYTFGMKESYTLAYYAYTRLLTVRSKVHILSACCNGEIESLLGIEPTDVCLVYLFHRYTAQALQILEILKKRKVPVILVTDSPYEEHKSPGTLILPCRVDAGGIKNTYVAPVVLTDYLCNAAAVANPDAVLEYMNETEELFRATNLLQN